MRTCTGGRVVSDGVCVTPTELVRTVNADGVPTRCVDGFFLDGSSCLPCDETHDKYNETCTTFLSCDTDDILSNRECVAAGKIPEKCKTLIPSGSGCALCKRVFYRNGTECVVCSAHCATCSNMGCCVCDDAFWTNTTSKWFLSLETLALFAVRTQRKCTTCDGGFFVNTGSARRFRTSSITATRAGAGTSAVRVPMGLS